MYLAFVAVFVIELATIALTDFHLGRSNLVRIVFQLFAMLVVAAAIRRLGFSRVAILVEAVAILPLAGSLAVAGTVLLAGVSAPFVDDALASADQALGFDFVALTRFYAENPNVAVASRWVYGSFALQSVMVPVVVAIFSPERFWALVRAWTLCLIIAVILFPFLPAAGPFVHFGVTEDVFPNLLRLFPWETGPTIEAIRSGSMRDIGQAARGLISIPSFHAVGALLFTWAAWPSRWLRWPMASLNTAVVASAIVSGSHYMVDLIAGLGLALAILGILRAVDQAPSHRSSLTRETKVGCH